MDAETAARLCVVAVVVALLVGAGAQTAAAGGESTATSGDSALAASAGPDDQSDDAPLSLGISPKRALVSLAFLGAVFARRRRPTSRPPRYR